LINNIIFQKNKQIAKSSKGFFTEALTLSQKLWNLKKFKSIFHYAYLW